jgi:hypothetical protein
MSRDAHHAPNATYYEAQLLAARALVERLRKRVKAPRPTGRDTRR